jgi:hypothetical protein
MVYPRPEETPPGLVFGEPVNGLRAVPKGARAFLAGLL